jgi:hypothetical protein
VLQQHLLPPLLQSRLKGLAWSMLHLLRLQDLLVLRKLLLLLLLLADLAAQAVLRVGCGAALQICACFCQPLLLLLLMVVLMLLLLPCQRQQ